MSNYLIGVSAMLVNPQTNEKLKIRQVFPVNHSLIGIVKYFYRRNFKIQQFKCERIYFNEFDVRMIQ